MDGGGRRPCGGALGLVARFFSNPVFNVVHSQGGFYFIIGVAFLLCCLFSGLVFGFVPLQSVMIENGVHSDLCHDEQSDGISPAPTPTPAPVPSPSEACSAQLLKLYTMYTIATTVLNLLSLPSGFVVDHLGARPSLLLSLSSICLSFCIFALGGYTLGYTLMGCSGILVYLSLFYLADLNEGKRGLVMGLTAGGFNSSTITFLILKPMERWGLDLAESFFLFAVVGAVMLVVVFLFFPPSRGKLQEGDFISVHQSLEQVEEDREDQVEEEEKEKEKEGTTPPLAHLTFTQQLLTLDNFFLVLHLAFSNLFILFYQSTLDQQLESMSPDKPSLVASYTSLFFLLLPIVTALGMVVTSGFLQYTVVAMAVGRLLLIISSFVLLIPIVRLQIIGFILLPLGNLLLWSTTPDMILRVFGPANFGVLFGFGMTISGPVSALSFLFVYLSLTSGSWIYVDILLFVIQLGLGFVPFYFWRVHYWGKEGEGKEEAVEQQNTQIT